MNQNSSRQEAQIRVVKKMAAVIGTIVVLIFIVTGAMGWIYFNTAKPVKEFFQEVPVAERMRNR